MAAAAADPATAAAVASDADRQQQETPAPQQPQQQQEQQQQALQLTEADLSDIAGLRVVPYTSELQLPAMAALIAKDLSEPYSVYTYRFFLSEWPQLCLNVMDGEACVGVIIGRIDMHGVQKRGYIGMLAVEASYRKRGIGSALVRRIVIILQRFGCDEVVLEAEASNRSALTLYENLGFVRDKRLQNYYLNNSDAFRLKLWLR